MFRFKSSTKAVTWVGLIGLTVMTYGCARKNEYKPPPPPKVKVACPLRQSITNYLVETGTTEAAHQAEVRARVTGFLEEIRFEPGAEVSEGDVLYVIEQREYQAKLAAAKAELAARAVELARGETEYQRERSLQEKNATSDRELVRAKTARDEAQAAVDLAEANLELAQKDMDDTEVRALIDGRIGKTLVKVGNLVDGTQGTQLTTIVDYDPIYANFNITENQLLELREAASSRNNTSESSKEKVKLYLQRANDTGFPFEGHFDYADLAVDQSTGTYMVRGVFLNPGNNIIPGLFVRIKIPLGMMDNALLIPEQAVSSDQRGDYVLVVDEGEVERRGVELGLREDGLVVVLKGVSADERVIVEGLQKARPGSAVNIEEISLKSLSTGSVVTEGQRGPSDPAADDGSPKQSNSP